MSGSLLRRVDPRHGALAVLSLAAVTALAVLVGLLVPLPSGVDAYGAGIPITGPLVRPDENPMYAIQDVLTRQSEALLRGDRAGYLRAIPADRQGMRDQAAQRFDSLTALHVTRWTMTTDGIPSQQNGEWRQPVAVTYCFAAADCTPIDLRIDTRWSVVNGRLQLVTYEQTTRPWDATALTAREGSRVTVAGPAADPDVTPALLDRVLAASETAAGVDDRFATSFDGPPRRYFVYVAGRAQWNGWYQGGGANAAAYTMPLQPGVNDIVVDEGSITSDTFLLNLMTHEFAHVVTLGGGSTPAAAWWLIEGIAEYIADGQGASRRKDLPSVRTWVAAGKWDGSVALTHPAQNATLEEAIARYGIALLAVTYLAQHFGEAKMLAFFTEVVRRRQPLDAAAQSALGTPWPTVATDAAAAVRAALSEQ